MARSAKAIPWFLFAAGGTITAFVLPVMLFVTNIAPPLGLFQDALSYETMSAFVGNWLVKLVLFGIIGFGLWHAAHRRARLRHPRRHGGGGCALRARRPRDAAHNQRAAAHLSYPVLG